MRGWGIIPLLTLALAVPVTAREAVSECVAEVAPELFHLDVEDLGSGLTSYLENSETAGSVVGIDNCYTGSFARATVWRPRGKGRSEYPAAMAVFEDAFAPDVVTPLMDVIGRWQDKRVPVVTGISRKETCACAARYPGLRGTKEPYGKR